MKDNKALIYLVEDNKIFLKTLENHMKTKTKHEIRSFETGEACLAQLEANPDIIILDYYLDGEDAKAKNGMEILQSIRKSNPDIQVIMLSGQDKLEVAVETIKHGAYDYIIKNETCYVRSVNVVGNILDNVRLHAENKQAQMTIRLLVGLLAFIVVATVVGYLFFPSFFGMQAFLSLLS